MDAIAVRGCCSARVWPESSWRVVPRLYRREKAPRPAERPRQSLHLSLAGGLRPKRGFILVPTSFHVRDHCDLLQPRTLCFDSASLLDPFPYSTRDDAPRGLPLSATSDPLLACRTLAQRSPRPTVDPDLGSRPPPAFPRDLRSQRGTTIPPESLGRHSPQSTIPTRSPRRACPTTTPPRLAPRNAPSSPSRDGASIERTEERHHT